MNNIILNNKEELLLLIKNYNDPLNLNFDESKSQFEEAFYKYVIEHYTSYLSKALLNYKNALKTNPYNFNYFNDRKQFIQDVLADKLYPQSKHGKSLILYLDPNEKDIKTYLFSVINNAVLTLIRVNEKIPVVGKEDIELAPIQGDSNDSAVSSLEEQFPLLFDSDDLRNYPYVFVCKSLTKFEFDFFKNEKPKYDERVLKWRSA